MKISLPRKKGPGRGGYRRKHGNKPNHNFRYGVIPPPYSPKPYSPVRTWNEMSEEEKEEIKLKLGLA